MATVKELTNDWMAAKTDERLANLRRIAIEEQLVKLVSTKEEGSITTDIGDGIKVTTTGKLSYKVDRVTLDELTESWPEDIRPVRLELKVDETRLKKIRAEQPKLWSQIARAVEVKPQKTGVSIEIEE
ncbi:hypothetical protein UFOVP686_44 [uncultured Caudovirales phage]|uniref:Uncharacterized protein n=1 Tax=uncultured Caudovirales phage TaxID=2100421 RepID=A0A6J7X6M3_9CAUD|nr:hypothetical protein UFOVP686_44 [uncultured Caudovirales phage]CAB5225467.1 hypothetical protein UFOVP752_22 [uncultured Caudovirales phage]